MEYKLGPVRMNMKVLLHEKKNAALTLLHIFQNIPMFR